MAYKCKTKSKIACSYVNKIEACNFAPVIDTLWYSAPLRVSSGRVFSSMGSHIQPVCVSLLLDECHATPWGLFDHTIWSVHFGGGNVHNYGYYGLPLDISLVQMVITIARNIQIQNLLGLSVLTILGAIRVMWSWGFRLLIIFFKWHRHILSFRLCKIAWFMAFNKKWRKGNTIQ